jgi:redox-regulated HSP33 family molecular chaperone
MSLTLKKLRKFVWKKDGDSPLDYTSAYSEMPGELRQYTNEQHKRAMTATIDKEALDDKLRREGLI